MDLMVTHDVVEGSDVHTENKYVGCVSSLPKKESIMTHVEETVPQQDSFDVASGR